MREDRKLFRKCLDFVMKNEGYLLTSNDKTDRGGLTYCGITQSTYDEYCEDMGLPTGPVYEMPGDVLEDVYFSFWNECKCQRIMDPYLACYVFDTAVNSGSHRACRLLQKALVSIGVLLTVDGVVGPQTLRIIDSLDSTLILKHMRIHRIKFYEAIAEKDPSQKRFINGWLKRAKKVFEC